MKKKILIAALIAAANVGAQASPFDGIYVGAGLGAVWGGAKIDYTEEQNDILRSAFVPNDDSQISKTVDLKGSFPVFLLTVGYSGIVEQFYWAVEGQLGIQSCKKSSGWDSNYLGLVSMNYKNEFKSGPFGALIGKFGMSFNENKVVGYGILGVKFVRETLSVTMKDITTPQLVKFEKKKTNAKFGIGAGVEGALFENKQITMGLEYIYFMGKKNKLTPTGDPYQHIKTIQTKKCNEHTVVAKISYHFEG